ncbi:MAG TPA: PIG-L family deacetylase [Gemmatimonadaceae bacterium]|nr:PIG-L family deacetylase [Gemmatimonadaceae bacterium]
MIRSGFIAAIATLLVVSSRATAQRAGAAELGELIRGLSVNTRVLVIAAHPDDEDTQLITWLARGRQVETAYLSLTRGDGGQNIIGNELGEALGAIRTEELLAARRIDGGHQYFTRAYDFGFSKSAEETYKHWPKDSILRDVVSVVRDFRPHVIIAMFTGTPRDGHGHHQVSGLLAREAFDLSGDSVRMPSSVTHDRAPWTPLKFYRSSRFGGESTYRFDVGEYSPLRGASYSEIAAASRSQHKSQAQGSLQRKGVIMDGVRLEASRVSKITPGMTETSLFDGIDTTWARVARETNAARTDSIVTAIADAQRVYDPAAPEKSLDALGRVRRYERALYATKDRDAAAVFTELERRVDRAIALASGIAVEAVVDHETWAEEEPARVVTTLYNRSRTLPMNAGIVWGAHDVMLTNEGKAVPSLGSVQLNDTLMRDVMQPSGPWWLARPRIGDIFGVPIIARPEDYLQGLAAYVVGEIGSVPLSVAQPVVYRFADPVKGEIQRPIAIVPAVTVTVDQPVQFVPANRSFERVVRVELRSASAHPRTVRVSLQLPDGLRVDSAVQTIGLPDYAGNFGGEGEPQGIPGGRAVAGNSPIRTVEFRVNGTVPEGRHLISAVAESEGVRYKSGYTLIQYDHIRPQRLFHDATLELSAVNVKLASGLNVAYIPGVGDNVAPMLEQLGVPVTIIQPERVATADLSHFTTVVVGPRAYESSSALVAANPRLLDFARSGRTLVVQYGQFEMANPGMMPYPITIVRPADRVTEENAAVRITDPASPILNSPNRIGPADWADWVQERTLYMPRSHDERYRTMLSMNDTGEPPNDGAILIAPLGKGTYVYTTLALFRQLPAGVPGGARLFVNLLRADQRSAGTPSAPPKP